VASIAQNTACIILKINFNGSC